MENKGKLILIGIFYKKNICEWIGLVSRMDGLICLRIGIIGEPLRIRHWTSGFHKPWIYLVVGISLVYFVFVNLHFYLQMSNDLVVITVDLVSGIYINTPENLVANGLE